MNAVLEKYQKELDVLSIVYICTKNTKIGDPADFRVPVPRFIYEIVERNRSFYSNSNDFISGVIRNAYLRNIRGVFRLHGSGLFLEQL